MAWPVVLWQKLAGRIVRRATNRHVVRWSLVSVNVLLLLAIGVFTVRGARAQQVLSQSVVQTATSNEVASEPLDQLSSADIAVNVSRTLNLPEIVGVTNQADSVATQQTVAPADTAVVAKPESVLTTFKSNKDIETYIVQAGDTVGSIAAKFGITSDSLRWSNGLTGSAVDAGTKLLVPPDNGVVYFAKGGDTIDSLAQKYRANKDQLIAVNDLELTGIHPGLRMWIPNGQPPVAIVAWQGVAIYGPYNGYDYGFCTWYVADHRAKLGHPLPSNLGNASTWDSRAAAMGLPVNRTPAVGAAAVTSYSGAGHVVYVEQVNADGSIWVTEMNSYGQTSMTNTTPRGGWGIVDWKLIPASRASGFNYIH